MKKKFQPYENEAQYFSIGELEIENRVDMVEVHGSLALTCDQEGLRYARELSALVQAVLQELESRSKAGTLPEQVEFIKPKEVRNPFE